MTYRSSPGPWKPGPAPAWTHYPLTMDNEKRERLQARLAAAQAAADTIRAQTVDTLRTVYGNDYASGDDGPPRVLGADRTAADQQVLHDARQVAHGGQQLSSGGRYAGRLLRKRLPKL